VTRGDVQVGLSYRAIGQGAVSLRGRDGEHGIGGAGSCLLTAAGSGPVGTAFENALDLGGSTGGSIVYDEMTSAYTEVSSGDDIWDGGDRFQFDRSPHGVRLAETGKKRAVPLPDLSDGARLNRFRQNDSWDLQPDRGLA